VDLHDLLEVSFRNLRKTKLRASLTIAGVVIAIATFVAMLSFASGNHRYFTRVYNEFGLMNQMSVTPMPENTADSVAAAVLDGEAIGLISEIPGVRLAYPYSVFDVTASIPDTTITCRARVLPRDAVRTQMFSKILGGADFTSETAKEAVVTQSFLDAVGATADSLLGERLIISVKVASLDSAMAASMDDPNVEINTILRKVDRDSLYSMSYRQRFFREEMGSRIARFVKGLMERQGSISDTLTIIGTAPSDRAYQIRTAPIVIPEETARRLSTGGVLVSTDPADLLMAVKEGGLFEPEGAYDKRGYPRVTLELEPLANHKSVKDSVEALGYRAYSFAEQFEEMQRFMVYYYVGLGVIGVIALVTASLGIINTLVMSITERRREIGILKSLGAHESDIKKLFLVESAVIGAAGSAIGIVVGWLGTRIVAAILGKIMEREEMPIFDPFALPIWLIALALGFGILVSLAAGLYPAARAARVDPVEALRTE
jgi:putative ABC transport system permease protein